MADATRGAGTKSAESDGAGAGVVLRHWRLALPSWLLGLAVFIVAFDAEAATRSLSIREPNPLFADTTLMFANVGLVLVVVLQIARGFLQRKNKYKAVKDWQSGAAAGVGATPTPSPAPPRPPSAAARAAPAPSFGAAVPQAAAAPTVVQCASCGQKLSLKVTTRPVKFRCPKCQTVGVLK